MRNVQWVACLLMVAGLVACGEESDDTASTPDTGIDSFDGADDGETTDTEAPDGAGEVDTEPEPEPPGGYAMCWPELEEVMSISIDALGLPVPDHCAGTGQQEFAGIERVVFFGDSITAGVGGGATGGYRRLLSTWLQQTYPGVQIDNCSVGGAVNRDLLVNQIPQCFPEPEDRKTLVIFTSGGNDVFPLALGRRSVERAQGDVERIVGELRDALAFLTDPENTPGGVRIIYANIYEFTDATGNLESCQRLAGVLRGVWLDGITIYGQLQNGYAQAAVDFGADMMFLEEPFCGHGHNRLDPEGPCFFRAGDLWLDDDCIHPNGLGHTKIYESFRTIIESGL